MTDQNQQTVMLTDVHGNEYHSNMRSVTAILEHKYAGEVLLAFGISSAIKIPKSLNELIEKCNLNKTAGFVTFTDPDNGDRILLNAHKKTGLVLVCNPYFKFDYFAIKKPQKVELDYIMKSALLGKAFEIFNDTMHAHEQVKLTNLINQLKLTHGDQDQ